MSRSTKVKWRCEFGNMFDRLPQKNPRLERNLFCSEPTSWSHHQMSQIIFLACDVELPAALRSPRYSNLASSSSLDFSTWSFSAHSWSPIAALLHQDHFCHLSSHPSGPLSRSTGGKPPAPTSCFHVSSSHRICTVAATGRPVAWLFPNSYTILKPKKNVAPLHEVQLVLTTHSWLHFCLGPTADIFQTSE